LVKLTQARRVLNVAGWLMFGLTALGVALIQPLLPQLPAVSGVDAPALLGFVACFPPPPSLHL
jgi:hypothetical protein